MDLVALYLSENSDDDEIKVTSKTHDTMKVSQLNGKDFRAIYLNDSENKLYSNIDKIKNNLHECTENVDYLNLNGSDSEGEQVASNNIDDLLCSASVLNEVSYGPNKCNELVDESNNYVSTYPELLKKSIHDRDFTYGEIKNSGGGFTNCDLSHKCICTKNIYSGKEDNGLYSKRFKSNFEFSEENENITNDKTSNLNKEKCLIDRHVYREDIKITEAFLTSNSSWIPRQISQSYVGHTNVVTALSWCIPRYSHLLLSTSADCTTRIWDLNCRNPVQIFKNCAALKAGKWLLDGHKVIIGGYGRKVHIFEVPKGKEIFSYDICDYVSSIEVHPNVKDVFLCGTKDAILAFDIRVNTSFPIKKFLTRCNEVLDICFLSGNEFVCSNNLVNRDSADCTIMAWDFSNEAILSNQIYSELYTCPSLKIHPSGSSFVAQTNGDYIVSFSAHKPYKRKNKRYMGHKVSGFGIECDISHDGRYLASGDANGEVYFYNYINTNRIHTAVAKCGVPTNKLRWHPVLPSVVAIAMWDGNIQIWK